jgi:glycosyltransferase involved in cell wall biosynthesis
LIKRSPSVCILLESYLPVMGGMERGARVLAEELTAKGCRVTLLTRRLSEASAAREHSEVGEIVRTGPMGSRSRLRWLHMFSCVPELIRLRHQYDVLWVAGFRVLGLPAVLVARLLGKRCILRAESCGEMDGTFFLNALPTQGIKGRLARLLLKLFVAIRNSQLRRATALVAISSEIRNEMLACRVADDRINVIHQSVDTQRFVPVESDERKLLLRRQLALPESACIFVFTGRLVAYKGLPTLLEAWQELPERTRAQCHLLLVGEGGHDMFNCEQALRKTVTQAGLAGSVTFTGAVDNVVDYLQASDVFVFPTENEAFGISIIEAMAVGLSTVSTLVGGVSDIVAEGETGLAVPPQHTVALTVALETLAQDPTRRARLGEAARKRVEEMFTQRALGEASFELVHRVDAGRDFGHTTHEHG